MLVFFVGFLAGAALSFSIARSVSYERWLRDRRDLTTLRRQQEIHDRLQKGMEK